LKSKSCLSCNRFFNQHSNAELLECATEIIKGVKDT
jgi:hypothetical protein